MILPAAIGASHFCFCAAVPPLMSALVRISGRVIRLPAAASEQRDSSSVVMIIGRLPMPPPPNSSGTDMPKKPSSLIFVDERIGNEIVGAVNVLGDRRHLGLGELAHRVAGHHGNLVLEPGVVGAALLHDVAADRLGRAHR